MSDSAPAEHVEPMIQALQWARVTTFHGARLFSERFSTDRSGLLQEYTGKAERYGLLSYIDALDNHVFWWAAREGEIPIAGGAACVYCLCWPVLVCACTTL